MFTGLKILVSAVQIRLCPPNRRKDLGHFGLSPFFPLVYSRCNLVMEGPDIVTVVVILTLLGFVGTLLVAAVLVKGDAPVSRPDATRRPAEIRTTTPQTILYEFRHATAARTLRLVDDFKGTRISGIGIVAEAVPGDVQGHHLTRHGRDGSVELPAITPSRTVFAVQLSLGSQVS